jgi:hypothetical protein
MANKDQVKQVPWCWWVQADFARTLERELSAAQKRCTEEHRYFEMAEADRLKLVDELYAAKNEIERLKSDHQRMEYLESLPPRHAFGRNPSGLWSIFGHDKQGIPVAEIEVGVSCREVVDKARNKPKLI